MFNFNIGKTEKYFIVIMTKIETMSTLKKKKYVKSK